MTLKEKLIKIGKHWYIDEEVEKVLAHRTSIKLTQEEYDALSVGQ